MTRHAKNCTAHTVYTYHERQKDALRSGYGTQEIRLGKDSVQGISCCCLTLQLTTDPVVTPDGYVYDRAAILEYIVNQKAEIQRKTKLYEKQQLREAHDAKMRAKAAKEEEARRFLSLNTLDTHAKASAQAAEAEALATISGPKKSTSQKAAAFWTPTSSNQSSVELLAKPDPVVRCPMSGKPLRYKELIGIKFYSVDDNKGTSSDATSKNSTNNAVQFYCAVSKDPLTNATPCVALKTSGSVVTKEVAEKIIKPEMIDPINGEKMVPSDFIELQRGSLGFADERTILTAKRHRPSMQT